MASQLRSETARQNGAKSHGPLTPEGKQAAAKNNLRHGLLSQATTLDRESTERFDALHHEIFTLLQPEGPIEIGLAENMVMCRWRLMRLWAMEAATLNHEMRRQASANEAEDKPTRAALAHRVLIDESRSLEVLSRYETRFDRQFSRAIQRFNELGCIRRAVEKELAEKYSFADEPKPDVA